MKPVAAHPLKPSPGRAHPAVLGGALVLLVLLAFWPALGAGYIWDDAPHIAANRHLRSFAGLVELWTNPRAAPQYYPLAHTSWWLEYRLWGDSPAGYHAINLLLHAANALLAWRVLRRLNVPGAWWAAALFAVHPVQTETVAWVMERKNLLSGFFYLLSLREFLLYFGLGTDAAATNRRRHYAVGALLFVCALLSKSVAASLPAAILLILWWKHGTLSRRDWLAMAPLLIVGAASGLFTGYLERTHVGAAGPEWAFSAIDRVLIAGRALWHYVATTFFPWPLMFFYPRWQISAAAWWQYLFPLGFLALLAALWAMRKEWGRGPLTAFLFFAGTVFPALGFVNVFPMRYSFVADHFQYLATLGLVALAAALVALVVRNRPTWANPMLAVQAILTTLLVVLSIQRSFVFRDALTLYADTVVKNPDGWAGHALLGFERSSRGNFEAAIPPLAASTQLAPGNLDNLQGLANAYLGAGQRARAVEMLEDVLRKDPTRPKIHNDLAGAYLVTGRLEDAERLYRQAIALAPTNATAYYNLGDLLARTGRFPDAAAAFQAALEHAPDWPEAAFKTGLCLAEQGKIGEALPFFERAAALRPGWRDAEMAVARARGAAGR